jgi:anthranilate synthase component 1
VLHDQDLSRLFRTLAAEQANVFWLDAGAGAAEGWSIVGTGEPEAAGPGHVRLDVAAASVDGPPFRDGWVGWLDYESGAERAGAPAAESEGGPAWLRVTSALALDHATGAVWELGERLRLVAALLAHPVSSAGLRPSAQRPATVLGALSEPKARRNGVSEERSDEPKPRRSSTSAAAPARSPRRTP